MAALITEYFDHQVGRAVNHFRVVGKILRGVNKTVQLNNPHQPIKVAITCRANLCN